MNFKLFSHLNLAVIKMSDVTVINVGRRSLYLRKLKKKLISLDRIWQLYPILMFLDAKYLTNFKDTYKVQFFLKKLHKNS